ncbi:MAG TPA: ABC transporter permease/substrate-binding protein, partial [Polyangiaceae bacterium]|nr:ABC transporter permease/substrate-binding protein [Polyangiaceae bacterium]
MADLSRELDELPALLSGHASITALGAGVAVLLGVPLGVLAARRPRLRAAVLGVAGVVQTIPGLALLALMVPLLGAFGFWPALVALVLYAMLPILRNTVTGITGVDAAVLEAADGMGMTPRQRLFGVELPLALPVILAGIRTAVVWTVGMATLSTPVGQPSLGSFIFAGLQTRDSGAVLVGCAAAAALAIGLDVALGALQASLEQRRQGRLSIALGALALTLSACVFAPVLFGGPERAIVAARPGSAGVTPASSATTPSAAHAPAASSPRAPTSATSSPAALGTLHIGAKTFTEQYVLARLIAARLEHAGFAVERHESLGSNVAFDALRQGDIDVYVEYTGTIWSSYMKRDAPLSSWRMLAATSAWLAETHGVRLLGALGFENAYCLAMRRDRAEALGVTTLADLARRGAGVSLGTDYEFQKRSERTRLEATYPLTFGRMVSFDPSFLYAAVERREVDVITAFSSDGRIDELGLVVLSDPEHAFPPYDAV